MKQSPSTHAPTSEPAPADPFCCAVIVYHGDIFVGAYHSNVKHQILHKTNTEPENFDHVGAYKGFFTKGGNFVERCAVKYVHNKLYGLDAEGYIKDEYLDLARGAEIAADMKRRGAIPSPLKTTVVKTSFMSKILDILSVVKE
jgi:hypothetical protein